MLKIQIIMDKWEATFLLWNVPDGRQSHSWESSAFHFWLVLEVVTLCSVSCRCAVFVVVFLDNDIKASNTHLLPSTSLTFKVHKCDESRKLSKAEQKHQLKVVMLFWSWYSYFYSSSFAFFYLLWDLWHENLLSAQYMTGKQSCILWKL